MTGRLLLQSATHWMGALLVVLWAIQDLPRPEAGGALADFSLPQRRRVALILCSVAAITVYLMLLSAILALGAPLGLGGPGLMALLAVLLCILALRLLPGSRWAWDQMRAALHRLAGFPNHAQEMASLLQPLVPGRGEAEALATSLNAALDPHGAELKELRKALTPEALALVLEAHRLHLRLVALVPAAGAAPRWHDLMRGRPGIAGQAGDGAGHAVGGTEAAQLAVPSRATRIAAAITGGTELGDVPPGLVPRRLAAWRLRQAGELARLSLYHGRLIRRAAEAAVFAHDLDTQFAPPGNSLDERRQRRLRERISTFVADEADTLVADSRRLLAGAALALARGRAGQEDFLAWAGYSGQRVSDLPVWPITAVVLIDLAVIGIAVAVLPAPPGAPQETGLAALAARLPFMFMHASGMALAAGLAVWPKLHFNAARPAFGHLPWRSYLAVGGLAWAGGAVMTALLLQATSKPPGARWIDLVLGTSLFFAAIAVAIAWRIDRRLVDRTSGRYAALRDGLIVGGSYLLVDLLFRLALQQQIGFLSVPNSTLGVKLPPAIVIWPIFFSFAAAVGALIPGYAASVIATAGIRDRRVPPPRSDRPTPARRLSPGITEVKA